MGGEKVRKSKLEAAHRELGPWTWGLSFPWGHEKHRRIMSKGFSREDWSLRMMIWFCSLAALRRRWLQSRGHVSGAGKRQQF